MNYLLIQNPGVAPVEGYTLLGMSTTRDCGVDGTIGQFGSGAKHAINILLRSKLRFWVYCGKTRLEFSAKTEEVNDGLVTKDVEKVYCKLGGTSSRTIDCGWCLDFGSIDWNDLGMALREFISNAIDRATREHGDFLPAMKSGDLAVKVVDESQRRANDGYTRVYVELSPEVQRYYGELPRRFLHFSENPSQVGKQLLPKADRNLSASKTPMIYRQGVLVREIKQNAYPSLFDYNFRPHELTIDECRNSSEYATRAACAILIGKAESDTLATIFKSLVADNQTFESKLDPCYLCPTWKDPDEQQIESWQKAWKDTAGEAVLCDVSTKQTNEFVERKGHQVVTIKAAGWIGTAERLGIPTAGKVLSASESEGRESLPATDAAIKATDIVWGWLEDLNMTQGKEKPQVACFRDILRAEASLLGYYENGVCYLREDIASDLNKLLLKTTFEEVVHYVTEATDNSRDFQSFLIDCIVEIAA